MEKPTRESIFRNASRKMRADFEDARNNVPHRGEAGGEGEEIVRNFLNDHLPGRFRATNGFIIDKEDNISGHTDVIIYDSYNCPVYRTSDRGMIIPNDNVASVFEVKFNLTTTALDSALEKTNEAKNLKKTPLSGFHRPGEMIETYGVVFAFESALSYETVFEHLHRNLNETNPFHKSCSMVVILDKCLYVTSADIPGLGAAPCDFQGISPSPIGTKVGFAFFELGENTLDNMLRLLLGHLNFFRHRMDHPGFNFQTVNPAPTLWVGEYVEENKIAYIHK